MPFGTFPVGHGDPAAFCPLRDGFAELAGDPFCAVGGVELEAPESLVSDEFSVVLVACAAVAVWLAFDGTQGAALGVAGPVGCAVPGAPGVGDGAGGVGSGLPPTFVV